MSTRSLPLSFAALAVVVATAAAPACQRVPDGGRVVPDTATPLPLSAVRLTGGPLKHAQDLNGQYLLELEPDRMMAYFRIRAGLEPKAEPYGGWDGDGRNLTGHVASHYLSGVSLMWAATGDPRFKERADYLVAEMAEVQAANGDGYLVALEGAREAFAELSAGEIRSANFDLNGLWSPWYTLHKTFAGLRDAYRYTGNQTALDVETRFAEWAEGVLAPLDDAQIQQMLGTEFGGMNEVLTDLYADTGDRRWLDLSYRFEHEAVLGPLKAGVDPLPGLHGNTQVPKLMGSAVRYGYTGDDQDLSAASFFWDTVVTQHTFATGGHGTDEYFGPPGEMTDRIDGRTAETCNVYNMLKLTRRLFALRPDPAYAEFLEQALFNHILGSMDPETGATCYMVPVGRGVQREYQNMERSFTCCVGSGMESHALHGLGIYYTSTDRLWVNLFVPSTAEWAQAGVRVEQVTDFPEGESAEITISTDAPRAFTLAVRRPLWAGEGYGVTVNGTAVTPLPHSGSYVEIDRTWQTGDQVSVTLPKALHLSPLPDNDGIAAVMWGPLVLAGDLGPEISRGRGAGPGGAAEPKPVPVLVAADVPVDEWLTPVAGEPGRFATDGVGRESDVEFVPFYRLHRRRYGAYWDVVTPAEWDEIAAGREAEAERLRQLELATIAFVPAGSNAAAREFNLQGEEMAVSRVEGRSGRRAGSWFSVDLPVEANATLALVVTYHTERRTANSFAVQVNGRQLAEQTVDSSDPARFFDVEYAIPADVVQGGDTVTVRFQATGDRGVSPVFGVRLIRK